MKSALARITLLSFLFFLFMPHFTSAETKTFTKEYTYQASEDDSRNSSRTIALREVKRLLLEELGTYLESETMVKNFQLTKDQVTAFTAGIVKEEVIDQKWDGDSLKYWLKAKITADTADVIKSIEALRKDRVKTKELEELKRRSDELLSENATLRKDLTAAKGETKQKRKVDYDENIKKLTAIEWFEKGLSLGMSGNYQDAIDAYSKAIERNPKLLGAYNNRGLIYDKLNNNEQAINDFDRALKLKPKHTVTYNNPPVVKANTAN
jgi:tetratricopeptide (TPR) repeat protein